MNVFETSRCNVRHLKIEDASFIFELTNTPEWLQFIGDRGIRNITDAENYIINGPMSSYEKYGHGLYKIILKSTAEAIGICGIIKRDTLEDKDIGFALLPEYTGNGYAYEMAAATLQHAKKELGVKRIVAITLPANIRSINLLTKLGLVYEKMISFPDKEEVLMLFASQ
ncbi:MAG: GNAT family N-acetyltransferase [Chitinophagaceae bacterium]